MRKKLSSLLKLLEKTEHSIEQLEKSIELVSDNEAPMIRGGYKEYTLFYGEKAQDDRSDIPRKS